MGGRHSPVDLHCHSTASDGTLAPSAVVERAAGQGVRLLALTDHDCVDGLGEAATAAERCGVSLLPALELSVEFHGRELHVVGLGVDTESEVLRRALEQQKRAREERASEIGRRLAKKGLDGAEHGARALADGGQVTRAHFARHLVAAGHAKDPGDAFRRYLRRGRPGYVPPPWSALADGVSWLKEAGAAPVLAHPFRYQLTGAWLRRVLEAFKAAGGDALEVVCGSSTPREIEAAVGHALRFELHGSVGSDFHGPENRWVELGRLAPLPAAVTPVWERWDRGAM